MQSSRGFSSVRGEGLDDIVEASVPHRLQIAGPAPVGGDDGLGEPAKELRQREHGAGERQLETDEIDADERGVLGAAREAGDAEGQDGGHGGIDEEEDEGLGREIAGEAADGIDEDGHPERLRGDEAGEEDGLAREIAGDVEAGELFLFKNGALAGDLAGGIV